MTLSLGRLTVAIAGSFRPVFAAWETDCAHDAALL